MAQILERAVWGEIDLRKQVRSMSTLDSFRSVIVSLSTSEKSEETSTRLPAARRPVGEELKKFEWVRIDFEMADFKNLLTLKPLFSAVSGDFSKLPPKVSICPP